MDSQTQSTLKNIKKTIQMTALFICLTPLLPVIALVWAFALLYEGDPKNLQTKHKTSVPSTQSIAGH